MTKAMQLQQAGMKPGEVQFYRFNDVSGIFQFYLAQDQRNIQVDRCDDGIVGVGQNYIWDRYPGEVSPEVPAHTLSVGLAGEPTGVAGCCGQTSMEPTDNAHHPQCEWEWSTCTCNQFLWDPSTERDNPGCVYQEPNYGSDQIHLLSGVGPLGPMNAQDVASEATMPAPANALGRGLGHEGLGQPALPVFPPATTVNPDGTVTIGDVTYTPPGGAVITPAADPTVQPTALPTVSQTQPGSTAVAPGSPGTWVSAPTPGAPATSNGTNTALLVAGLIAVAAGLGGIAYLAHAKVTSTAGA